MNYWKVILATMVIFCAGVMTGAALVRATNRARVPQRNHQATAPRPQTVNPGGSRLDLLRRMQRELALSEEQRQKIDTILRESQDRSRKLMEPIAPALREEVRRAKDEFREALTAAQLEEFDRLLKSQQQSKQHQREQRPNRERAR